MRGKSLTPEVREKSLETRRANQNRIVPGDDPISEVIVHNRASTKGKQCECGPATVQVILMDGKNVWVCQGCWTQPVRDFVMGLTDITIAEYDEFGQAKGFVTRQGRGGAE